jgi:glutathionyl-hydroquinone reductase
MGDRGWRFATADEHLPGDNVGPDPVHEGFTHLRQIYFEQNPDYAGRFTVPTLYDTKTRRVVNNESADIIRMFYTAFDGLLPATDEPALDLYPASLRAAIDEHNEWIYNDINNGVYKSGFATTQEAYERAVTQLFASLDRAERQLATSAGDYYFGERLTETDVRLYTTIARFDAVYVQHFKANLRDIRSGYPALHAWLRRLYWDHKAFGETTQWEHIKKHYTKSHGQINPYVSISRPPPVRVWERLGVVWAMMVTDVCLMVGDHAAWTGAGDSAKG